MPTTFGPKNPTNVLRKFRGNLTSRTGITNFGSDSKVVAIADALTAEIQDQRFQVTNALESLQWQYATGTALNDLAREFGVSIQVPQKAITYAVEKNLTWFVNGGTTFGSINDGNDIVLPAGQIVFSEANGNELGEQIQYELTTSCTLSADSAIGFCTGRAQYSGSKYNVGAGVLNQHNFTNYTGSVNKYLKVINNFAIVNGVDADTEDSIRYKLANRFLSLAQNNQAKLKLSTLSVPGVVDLKILPNYYGVGSVAVVVLGPENQSNAALVSAVQAKASQVAQPGQFVQAIPAVQKHLDLVISLTPLRVLNESEKQRVQQEIRRIVSAGVTGVSIGGIVDLGSIGGQLTRFLSGVASVGDQANAGTFYKEAYFRRGPVGSITDERQQLISSSFVLEQDEFCSLGTLEVQYVETL